MNSSAPEGTGMEKQLEWIRGGGYEAGIAPDRGAAVMRLRYLPGNHEILRAPASRESWEASPFLYGMPVLFPPNRIDGGCFSFGGRTYRFPVTDRERNCSLHGSLHLSTFQVEEQAEDRICMVYRADADRPYGCFPHAFTFRIRAETGSEGFRHEVQITNQSDRCMPLMLGFHTTFRRPGAAGDAGNIRLGLSADREIMRDPVRLLPTGEVRTVSETLEQLRQGCFHPWQGTRTVSCLYESTTDMRMVLEHPSHAYRVVYETEGYRFWMVYGGGSLDYLCVEPQTCMINAPNTDFPREETGFRSLAPGKTAVFRMKIHVEAGADVSA